jgi:cytoskeletal protein CcmA (bactofilin family)
MTTRESEAGNSAGKPAGLGDATPAKAVLPMPASKIGGADRTELGQRSIIGNDLAIMGERIVIITKGALQVDGEVQADLHCSEVVIGDAGKVTGTIWANSVEVRGQVYGTIRSAKVQLMSKSLVEGDIHHQSLSITEGAAFNGRVRRPTNPKDLQPTLDPNQHAGTKPQPPLLT